VQLTWQKRRTAQRRKQYSWAEASALRLGLEQCGWRRCLQGNGSPPQGCVSWFVTAKLLQTGLLAQRAQRDRWPGSTAAQSGLREASWALLRLLPKLASAAHDLCQMRSDTQPNSMPLQALVQVFPCHCADLGGPVCSAAEAAQVMAGTAAALSLLPLAHQVWQAPGAMSEPELQQSMQLPQQCVQLWACKRILMPPSDMAIVWPLPGSNHDHAAAA
jgi:hypothetical protein